MKDIAEHVAKPRADAMECEALAETGDTDRRAFLWRLAEHLREMASQMEKALALDDDGHDYPTRH